MAPMMADGELMRMARARNLHATHTLAPRAARAALTRPRSISVGGPRPGWQLPSIREIKSSSINGALKLEELNLLSIRTGDAAATAIGVALGEEASRQK